MNVYRKFLFAIVGTGSKPAWAGVDILLHPDKFFRLSWKWWNREFKITNAFVRFGSKLFQAFYVIPSLPKTKLKILKKSRNDRSCTFPPGERFWRDARVERIWDGTSEIQRHIISRDLLRPLGS